MRKEGKKEKKDRESIFIGLLVTVLECDKFFSLTRG